MIHTLIMMGTCQPSICCLTLTLFSWSTILSLHQFFRITTISPLPYNLCSPYFVHTLMTDGTSLFVHISLYLIPEFLYHLTNVFTNCSMNIDQLVFKLLEVTLVLVRKSLKFLLLRNQVPIVGQSMNNRNCVL